MTLPSPKRLAHYLCDRSWSLCHQLIGGLVLVQMSLDPNKTSSTKNHWRGLGNADLNVRITSLGKGLLFPSRKWFGRKWCCHVNGSCSIICVSCCLIACGFHTFYLIICKRLFLHLSRYWKMGNKLVLHPLNFDNLRGIVFWKVDY